MNRLPNFLIAGAAKCGTTALYLYLQDHPDIFFSSMKEPCYFSAQVFNFPGNGIGDETKRFTQTFEEYEKLFQEATHQKIIGEASPDTVYYPETIPYIHQYLGDPAILIMLRNPVDRALSAYGHLVRDNRENLSFEEALHQEENRIASHCNSMWHYKRRGMYSRQIKPFLDEFSRVKVVLFDDFRRNNKLVVKDICSYLGIDSSFEPTDVNSEVNVSGKPKQKWFNDVFLIKNPIQNAIRQTGLNILGNVRYTRLRDTIRKTNLERMTMKPETRAYLTEYFREDILQLQDLIGRDLSAWLKPKERN
jgi:hypothetical protein